MLISKVFHCHSQKFQTSTASCCKGKWVSEFSALRIFSALVQTLPFARRAFGKIMIEWQDHLQLLNCQLLNTRSATSSILKLILLSSKDKPSLKLTKCCLLRSSRLICSVPHGASLRSNQLACRIWPAVDLLLSKKTHPLYLVRNAGEWLILLNSPTRYPHKSVLYHLLLLLPKQHIPFCQGIIES